MKKMKLSETDRKIAGVCGGIAEFFGIDSSIIRILWAVLSFFSLGTGAIIYLACWAIIANAKKD